MFDFENVKTSEAGVYVKHGVAPVKVSKIEAVNVATAKYTGEAADIFVTDENGASTNMRLFPFAYSEKNQKYEKGQPIGPKSKEEQFTEWQGRVKHLFTKALTEENFAKATKGVKDFAGLIKNLKNACEKVGQQFAIMFVSDDKGYAKVPFNWTGGFAATLENIETLKDKYNSNITKYGPKTAPKNSEQPSGNSTNLEDLMGISTAQPVSGGFSPEPEDDDLPF